MTAQKRSTSAAAGRVPAKQPAPHRQQAHLGVPPPFDLRLAVHGHGWYDLPPFSWDEAQCTLRVVLEAGAAAPVAIAVDVAVGVDAGVRAGTAGRLRVECASPVPLAPARVDRLRNSVATMLRLDQDLEPFWDLCRNTPRLHWAAARGAGRLLRGATVFEDLLKLLFTTNCSWAATRKMTERVVEALGTPAPSGARSFPAAARCADEGVPFWRDVVRAGYRAQACVALADSFASGRLSEAWFTDPDLPTDELRRRLLTIRGFGPYAAGQALRLLGHYDDLALDSWCRARLAELRGRRKPPSDRAVAREYRPFGRYAGLALWLDLTRHWHEERESATVRA